MPSLARRLVHTRTISVEGYARDDGLWDLVASLRDVKSKDFELRRGTLPANEALHHMQLTVTVDRGMNIVDASARTLAAPFMGECETFPDVYKQLIGLNLMQGFRAAVRERLGGNKACTHITELAGVLPTVAIQSFAGEVPMQPKSGDVMPLQLDGCRALRLDGPIVAKYHPRWYRDKDKGEKKT